MDNEYSIALPRYQTHWKGTAQQWRRNWGYSWDPVPGGDDWDIENTRFAPVSALAYYWFRHYVESPGEWARTQYANVDISSTPVFARGTFRPSVTFSKRKPQKINGARLLGPALHAAVDVTVPHHTIGASGYGHQNYEDDFQLLYNKGVIRMSASDVRQHLRDRGFLRWGLEPSSEQLDLVKTLQITVVTGDEDGDGTDANVSIDFGPGQKFALDTDMDDFERWNDDTFTLQVKPGTKVSDLNRVRIRRDGNGSSWKLKAVYVIVNGVLLYGNSEINQVLGQNSEWNAADFVQKDLIDKQIWSIDKVMAAAGRYTFDYTTSAIGASKFRSAAFWKETHRTDRTYPPDELNRKAERMQHLLDLAVANVVRVIEMSQVDRGMLKPGSGLGFFKQQDRDDVHLVYRIGFHCRVQNPDQMTSFGGFWRVKEMDTLSLRGTDTGDCGFPNGFFRLADKPEVYLLYGSDLPAINVGSEYCHVADEGQMNAYGGLALVRTVEPGSDIARGRQFRGECRNP